MASWASRAASAMASRGDLTAFMVSFCILVRAAAILFHAGVCGSGTLISSAFLIVVFQWGLSLEKSGSSLILTAGLGRFCALTKIRFPSPMVMYFNHSNAASTFFEPLGTE